MATWTRPGDQMSADITNDNLSGRVYFSDEFAVPPDELRTEVSVSYAQGGAVETRHIDKPLTNCGLNASEQTAFKQLWVKIRDNALAADGWTET